MPQILNGKTERITSSTSTQIKTGRAKVLRVIIMKFGTGWTADFRDGTSDTDPLRFSLDVTNAKQNEIDIYNPDFKDGLRVVTAGTAGEIVVVWDD